MNVLMKKLNSENGSMTIFVIVGFIFCMSILISMYLSSTNYQIMALQAEQVIKETYEADIENMDQIHSNLVGRR